METRTTIKEILGMERIHEIKKELFGDKNGLSRKEAIQYGKAVKKAAVESLHEQGLTATDIASALDISEATVRNLLAK